MPDSPLPTSPPEQVVRFHLRTLLAVTAVVAVLAAIAGPFYRRQTPESQTALLFYWGLLVASTGLCMYVTWHGSWKLAKNSGAILYSLWTSGRRGRPLKSRPIVTVIIIGTGIGLVVSQSYFTVLDASETRPQWLEFVWSGFVHGMILSVLLMAFVPRPLYLCEKGVSVGAHLIRWQNIRSAKWIVENRSVVRLRRLDGDLFAQVPDRLRDGVQKLIVERTRFEQNGDGFGFFSDS